MKRYFNTVFILLIVICCCSCGQKPLTWQEQYDLGIRYLEDGNYEEAIIAFEAAIQIEAMKPEAYLALANVYIAQNKFDEAREILVKGYELTNDQSLKDKIDEIDSGNIYDYWGQPHKSSFFDENGALLSYYISEYSGKTEVGVTAYNAQGDQTDYWDDFRYDSHGNCTRYFIFGIDTGKIIGHDDSEYNEKDQCIRMQSFFYNDEGSELRTVWEFKYDQNGNEVESYHYDSDGEFILRDESTYDNNGRLLRVTSYDSDGVMTDYTEYIYDDAGKCIGNISYDSDGNEIGSSFFE